MDFPTYSENPSYAATATLSSRAMRNYNFPRKWSRNAGTSQWDHPWVSTYRLLAIRTKANWGRSCDMWGYSRTYEEPQEYFCQIFFDCKEDLERFLHDHQDTWHAPHAILHLAIPAYWNNNRDERREWMQQLKRMGAYNFVPRGETFRDVEGKPRVSYNVYFQKLEDAKAVYELYQSELYAKHWHVKCQYRIYKWAPGWW